MRIVRARSTPIGRAARHRAEPGRVLPGARSLQTRSTRRSPASWRECMDRFAQAHRPATTGASTTRRARRRARARADGLGRRRLGRGGFESSSRPARRSACSTCASTARSNVQAFVAALPASVRSIAVLDRTKEPGAIGEPLYQDVITALAEGWSEGTPAPRVIGGRYGLSSKEYTPAMAKAALDELAKPQPKRHFTVGIVDDVTRLSLAWDEGFDTEPADVTRALFYGLGADGTVGATKNSVKIIGENTPLHAAGVLRLRQQEVGGDHGLALAVRAAADRVDLPDPAGGPRRVPPVRVHGEARRPGARARLGATFSAE